MNNNLINVNKNYITDENEYSDLIYGDISLDNLTSLSDTRINTLNNKKIDLEKSIKTKNKFNEKDIGLNSPTSEAYFMIREEGDIDVYSSNNCRISLRGNNTINLFTHNFNIQSKKINIKCDPMGIKINGYVLNPIIFTACDTGLDKNSWRDLTLSASARTWNDGLLNPGYCRMDMNFKPFFPTKEDETEKMLDIENGWNIDE